MIPENFRFGGGSAETALLPLVALYLLVAVGLILAVPRKKAITPFLLAYLTIPVAQVIVLGGFHFTALRILILAGLARRTISPAASSQSQGKYPWGFNGLDRAVILWSVSAVVIFCLQFPQKQALINAAGTLLDTLGLYLVVRFLIPDREAMRVTVKTLAAVCVIQGVPMIIEQFTRINVFGFVAGVPLDSAIRDGSVRASGTLGALTSGPLGALLIPMFLWLWTERKSRMAAVAGVAGAIAMVITSNSSTSLMALMGSFVGLAFWPLRRKMRLVRQALVTLLVGLHLAMKAPVWALIARVDLTGSSSSWQRYSLVNMTIRNFKSWWLLGTPDYINWGWDSYDLCNQFVAVALTGGLLALIVYIAIFKRGFAAIGTARKLVEGDLGQEWLLWCVGTTLFATVFAYFGINAGVVLIVSFFVLVAFIPVATVEAKQASRETIEAPARAWFPSGHSVRKRVAPWLKT